MKTLLRASLVVSFHILFLLGLSFGQDIPQKQVEITWSVENVEEDIQHYQLYVSDSKDLSTFEPAGEKINFSPLADVDQKRLSTNYTFDAPKNAVTVKWFTVTAIDTSKNESSKAEPIKVTVDNMPPEPPKQLTITVVIRPKQ